MVLTETVQDYSTQAAQSFIQTAVFVDDRIYQSAPASSGAPKQVLAPKLRKMASRRLSVEGDQSQVASEAVPEEDPAPDSYDIVNSFAKKQIVCSLYQPKKPASFGPASDIFPLCRAADVVIVDWDLFGDKGHRALELIDGLIAQALKDVPEQLRLILVYTQEPNLFGVANEIYQKVHPSIGDSFRPLQEEEGLAFHTENSRVAVLGKPGRERVDIDPRHVVNEIDLADVAVREFAKLASGILHATALLGLAEIRKNSRKILSKFNRDLDPAFLTHLAMSLPGEDASSHVIPLLVSEIEAVLEDALPKPLIRENIFRDWCQNVWTPGEHLGSVLNQEGLNYREIAEDICTLGFKKAREKNSVIPRVGEVKHTRKAAKVLLPSEDSDANHRFSHLMASRTFYGATQRSLKLGSIVYDVSLNQYLVCIQPVCDSVRLEEPRAFVFVRMVESEQNGGNYMSHVIFKADGSPVELIYQPKSYLCFAASFSPDKTTQEVIAQTGEDGELYFIDSAKKRYVWVDQLRTSHAQRAVERFASDLSRVGLTESEWLRRLQK